jgi:hypothetical protein
MMHHSFAGGFMHFHGKTKNKIAGFQNKKGTGQKRKFISF